MTDTPAPAKLGPATAYMIAVGVMLADQAVKTYVTEAMHLPTLGSDRHGYSTSNALSRACDDNNLIFVSS